MIVRELIALLQKVDPNAVVILSCDEEGNRFGPLFEVSHQKWSARTRQVYLTQLTDTLRKEGFSEEDLCPEPNCQPALVFWPA